MDLRKTRGLHRGIEVLDSVVCRYCVPDSEKTKLHKAAKELVPELIRDRAIWLPEDTAMVRTVLCPEPQTQRALTGREVDK